MKIMGIDPGLADVGYGIIERAGAGGEARHVVHGVIQTKSSEPMAARLDQIYLGLTGIIELHKPDQVAVEELFFSTNIKTAMVVAQARGVAILATARAGIPLAEYSPPQIKQALAGYGRASKMQIQLMVRALLALPEIPRPDHAADALATALCHLHTLGSAVRRAEAAQPIPPSGGQAGEENPNKILLAQTRRGKRRR